MTTTYDPHHPAYLDEADVRGELTRVFDVCQGCRRCTDLCGSFPTLFELLDRFDDRDAGSLTPLEQDRVVEGCFQCAHCVVGCPYEPGAHESAVDFPRLMLRAEAMRRANGHRSRSLRAADRTMTRPDRIGRIGSFAAPVANRLIRARPGSLLRRLLAAATGWSATRSLPPFAHERFSTWFARRPTSDTGERRAHVTLVPTCVVEYHAVDVGRDVVEVYERNGIECSLSTVRCCGAPTLHAGDVRRFARIADANVRALAAELRSGGGDDAVVVVRPACARTVREHYADACAPELRDDAGFVADHTLDASEYLLRGHATGAVPLDTDFAAPLPEHITHHAAARRSGDASCAGADLLALTGASVTPIERGSGVEGLWGLRAGNEAAAVPIARTLADEIERDRDAATARGARCLAVTDDDPRSGTAIADEIGSPPLHPLGLLRRAYGIDDGIDDRPCRTER